MTTAAAVDVRTEHREGIGMARAGERVEVGVGSHGQLIMSSARWPARRRRRRSPGPGRSSIGPYSVMILRKRGPLIARSQRSPLCDRKMVSCHFSKPGRHRLIADSTAACRRDRAPASEAADKSRSQASALR